MWGGGQERNMLSGASKYWMFLETLRVVYKVQLWTCDLEWEKSWWVWAKPVHHWETSHSSWVLSAHPCSQPLPTPNLFQGTCTCSLLWKRSSCLGAKRPISVLSANPHKHPSHLISSRLWKALPPGPDRTGLAKERGRGTGSQIYCHEICLEPRPNFLPSLSSCVQTYSILPSLLLSSHFGGSEKWGFPPRTSDLRFPACIPLTCPSQVVPAPSLILDLLDLVSESTPPTAPPSSSEGWDWTSPRPFPSREVSEFTVVSAKCLLQVLGIHCFYPSPSQGVNIQVTTGDGQENSVLSWKLL